MAGNRIAIHFRLEMQPFQRFRHLIHRKGCPEQAVAMRQCLLDDKRPVITMTRFHRFLNTVGAAVFFQQLNGTIHRTLAGGHIDFLREARCRFRDQIQPNRRMTNRGMIEMRRLQEKTARIFIDHRFFAAHDAGDSGRLIAVENQKIAFLDFKLCTIESRHRQLTIIGHRDFMNRQLGKIIEMHRLPGLKHHKVGDINQIVDGIHACRTQTVSHPFRARSNLDMVDDLAEIPGALVRLCGNLEIRRRTFLRRPFALRQRYIAVKNGADFHGHVPHRRAVGTVRRQRHIENHIIEAEILQNILFTYRCIGRQLFNAVDLFLTQRLPVNAKLKQSTQHAVGFDAVKRTRLNHAARKTCPRRGDDDLQSPAAVGCAADNLQRLRIRNSDLRLMEMGTFHIFAFHDLADDKTVRICQTFNAFHFQAGIGHAFSQLLGRDTVEIYIFGNPVITQFHVSPPPAQSNRLKFFRKRLSSV